MDITDLFNEFNDIIHDAMERKNLPDFKRRLAVLASRMDALADSLPKNEILTYTAPMDGVQRIIDAEGLSREVELTDQLRRSVGDSPEEAHDLAVRLHACMAKIAELYEGT